MNSVVLSIGVVLSFGPSEAKVRAVGARPVRAERTGFRRARSPEQKQQRCGAILRAARELAVRNGVGTVSLAAIAAEVGMHKSALLKYFGTREEIFLRLAEDEWRDWADGLVAELAVPPADDEALVEVLTASLVGRPLFCQVLIHSALTLERNVSLEAVRRSKAAATRAADAVADALHAACPALDRAAWTELLMATGLVTAGLWQVAHPPPVVTALYAESPGSAPQPSAPLCFAGAVARFIRVHLAGLRCADRTAG